METESRVGVQRYSVVKPSAQVERRVVDLLWDVAVPYGGIVKQEDAGGRWLFTIEYAKPAQPVHLQRAFHEIGTGLRLRGVDFEFTEELS